MARQTTDGDDGASARALRREAVAIVTGGSSGTGREVAQALASWGWAIVVVYLEDQRTADATVTGIQAAEGRIVAVRANLADDLDVQRLFAESGASFGAVDVVVHTTSDTASVLYQHAARYIRSAGAIVSVSPAESVAPLLATQFRERGITVGTGLPEEALVLLERWREQASH